MIGLLLISLLLTVAAVTFAVDTTVYGAYHVPKYFAFLVALALTTCAWCAHAIIKERELVVTISFIEIILLVRLAWLAFQQPSIVVHPSDLGFWLLVGLFLLCFVVRQIAILGASSSMVRNRSSVLMLVKFLWVLALVQAGIGLSQWILATGEFSRLFKTPVIGTIGPPNGFGTFMAIGVLCAVIDGIRTARPLRWISFSAALVMAVALALNGSRGAMLALLAASMILMLLLAKANVSHAATGAVAGLRTVHFRYALVAGISVMLLASAGLFLANTESSSGRLMIWKIAAPIATEHPVGGIGYGRFGQEYLRYQAAYFEDPSAHPHAHKAAGLHQPHNEFLMAFIEGGVVGGILFLSIWIMAAMALRREIYQRSANPDSYVIAGVLLVILVHALVDDPLHVLPIAVVAYFCLGLLPLKPLCTIRVRSWWLKSLALVLVTAMVVFTAARTLSDYPGYREWRQGVEAASVFSWNRAIDHYERALKRLPEKHELKFHLGAAMIMKGELSKGISLVEGSLVGFRDRNQYLSLSYGHLQRGEVEKAVHYAETALAMFPDHLAPHLLLAEIYHHLGDHDRAKASLLKCINRNTRVQSSEIARIARDAQVLWEKFYTDD